MNDFIKIAVWANGFWCEECELLEHDYKGSDFTIITISYNTTMNSFDIHKRVNYFLEHYACPLDFI